ncbi:hypothetical protein UY3_04065 [Chelonia mydas]|uniref:Uncharacterized protein n=1 Tax=Chelonia mydas TaxID=8469 RepID=M7BLH1_CHEMY|nr:hypothetical protein UY3_04065 [Chelonia mydas]
MLNWSEKFRNYCLLLTDSRASQIDIHFRYLGKAVVSPLLPTPFPISLVGEGKINKGYLTLGAEGGNLGEWGADGADCNGLFFLQAVDKAAAVKQRYKGALRNFKRACSLIDQQCNNVNRDDFK